MSNLTKSQHEELLEYVSTYISTHTHLIREDIYQAVDDGLIVLEANLQEQFEAKL